MDNLIPQGIAAPQVQPQVVYDQQGQTVYAQPQVQPQPTMNQQVQPQVQPQPTMSQQVQPQVQPQPAMNQQVQPQVQPQPTMNQQVQPQVQPQPTMSQQVQPQVQPQPTMSQQVQPQQGTSFYGALITPQDLNLVNSIFQTVNGAIGFQLSDDQTVYKSAYFGARDLFKTVYVNQISAQNGARATTPDYELATRVFEDAFGTVAKPRVNLIQLCLTMKAFAPDLLPDCVPGNRPHQAILDRIIEQNWHSQNVRNNSGLRNGNGSANQTNVNNPYPLANGSQSKASATAPSGYVNPAMTQQQPIQPVYNPQQTAQQVTTNMPSYNYA